MPEMTEPYYVSMLKGHGFTPDPDDHQYGALGLCWKLSPEIGEGSYWTYGQKDLYDIKIHNFSFHEDSLLEFSLPECLSITRYDSISGEELAPYRRLSAGCIKTYIGGYEPYQVLIHKNICQGEQSVGRPAPFLPPPVQPLPQPGHQHKRLGAGGRLR